ncbi:SDR family NAD(P)-dependent oxidoreductase [Erwinia psidii]|uniref:type I polyketide synthase n=1 Tax=Erwinia psidii TaxID=69224 RepID=UPI00226B4885|nr:type I polyketide synthase [Erwinia psidii]MCX8966953.1 SDR family NAD(P)-dependent oxidoreductase [Erwinia psidii]
MTIEELLNHHYPDSEPLAVIGHACRFPEAGNSDAFWDNLLAGRECNRHFSRQQLLDAGQPAALIDDPNYVPCGTVLEDADAFDAALFGYSRQEAELIDPQQRLFLQIAWHALEHAGYAPGSVAHKTGVFAAARLSTYPGREPVKLAEVAHVRSLQSLMGNDKDYVATRVAHKLDLRGPALTVQTACSSSLVAIHMACESLRSGECDMAIAGGVAVSFPQTGGYLWQQGMIFSPDGHCRPFDAQAQGTFAGNGVAAVVVRRLADALRDGDPVVAVVLGSAVNNDGSQKVGYTAPSVAGQREVIADAWSLAGVKSQQIGMIEAHGTATPMGDPIELQALHGLFHASGEGPICALGSVKSNLGHLDTAAGVASFLKAVLSVNHGIIPPTVNFSEANPALHLEQGPFCVPTTAQAWNPPVRIAGVSSFGIGGTNCHMVVASLPEALRPPQNTTSEVRSDQAALLLSAGSEQALRQLAGAYAQDLQQKSVADLVYTALHGRALNLDWRLAVPVCAESAEALAAFSVGEEEILVHSGHGTPDKRVWLFTGQGSQWPGMAKNWYDHSPAFAAALDHALTIFDTQIDRHYHDDLRRALLEQDHDLLQQMTFAQPAIVAFELAMAAHWQAHGLVPDQVIGHSVGEFAAAVVAGHYSAEQIMPLVRRRGALMDSCIGGAMLAVFATEAETLPVAQLLNLDLAAYNGQRHLVYSGEREAIKQMAATLDDRGIRTHLLNVTGAAHSLMLDPVLDEFQQACATLQAQEGRLSLISGLTGTAVSAEELNHSTFWRRHMRQPVRFIQCLQHAVDKGVGLFLEMGPEASLTGSGEREFPDAACWIASARRNQPAAQQMKQVLLRLFAAGVELPWPSLFPAGGRKCHGPLYPFAQQRYWRDAGMDIGRETVLLPTKLPSAHSVVDREGRELDLPRLEALYRCVIRLHAIYVDRLVRRCVGDAVDRGVTALAILRRGRLLPRHRQLLVRLLNACVEDGYLQRSDDSYTTLVPAPHADLPALLDSLQTCCEGLDVIPDTVQRAGENLYAMMSGEVEPVAVIFPEGASRGVEVLYQDFSFGRYFNQIAAGVVTDLLRQHRSGGRPPSSWRILEVGGGTGGTTAWVLPALKEHTGVHYTFSDISPLFTRRAAEKFADYNFVSYREFDLQKGAAGQGFDPGSFDLIVAANVIHATQHVGNTLANLLPLLKPGGKLLMREITRPMRLFDFVFGPLVLPLHDEAARGGELFLTTGRWREQCLAAGFAQVEWLPEDGTPTAGISEHIVLATAPGSVATQGTLALAEGMLGQPLSNEGSYLADWSDCAGQQEAWRHRLEAACAEMARRHGNGRSAPLPTTDVPEWLSLVRLQWHGRPGGTPWMEVALCRPDGHWQSLTPHSLLPQASVPETHYDWSWQRAGNSGTPAVLSAGNFRLVGDTDGELATALRKAGVMPASDAVLVLVPRAGDLAGVSAPLPDILAETGIQRIVVVTHSAWAPNTGETVDAIQHAIWGMMRTAATELGRQSRSVSMIDLSPASGCQDLAIGLQAISGGEPGVVVRQGEAWFPRLVPQPWAAPALSAESLAENGWYIVTGGLGGLGRLSARWLIERGARRVALLVRQENADSAALLADLQHSTVCKIVCLVCNVADAAALTATLAKLDGDGGIAGVIHAAGILDDHPVTALNPQRLAPVLAVKADAATTLHRYLAARDQTAWLLLYSSAAATLGSAGQAAHALACAYLDGLAYASRGERVRVISIAWGAWGETGHAAQAGMQQRLAAEGMGVLSDAEGVWHLEQAISRAAPWRLAMRMLPDRLDETRKRLLGLHQPTPLPVDEPIPSPASVSKTTRDLPADQLRDAAAVAKWLMTQIAAQLRLDTSAQVAPERDLVQLGLDSLLFLELNSTIQRRLGVKIDAEKAYADLTVNGLSQLIISEADSARPHPDNSVQLQHDAAGRFDPFPLTPIQHAYWMGRTGLIDFGGVACHVVFEWDLRHDQFDLPRLEQAWNALVRRHDMLRMVIADNGLQRILAEVPEYKIARHTLIHLPAQQRQEALETTRQALCSRVLPTDRWPLFELIASECDPEHYRLHMNLDLLLFDVQSFKVMMDDLTAFYQGENPEPMQITFRDYVLNEQAQRLQPAWLTSWCWWQTLLTDLPPAPALPLSPTQTRAQPHFTTWQDRLDADRWAKIKQACQRWGVTPSAALMTLFAVTLERWARWPAFTLNLTFFNRRAVHSEMQQLIGDFTSVLLIDFDLDDASVSLRQAIEKTQHRLRQRLAHSQVNGVELLRELGRLRGQSRQPLMPVVFTSMLGMTLDGLAIDQAMTRLLGDPVHVFTQTPQVWLDHQVMEIDGELVFSWYCMDEVLAAGTAEAMFNDFGALLLAVAEDPALMEQPRQWQRALSDTVPPCWPAVIPGSPISLRDVEQAARQQPGILLAAAQCNAETDQLSVRVVAAERAYSVSHSPALSSLLPMLNGLDATAQAQFDAIWHGLEAHALHGIAMTLVKHDLFIREGQRAGLDEVWQRLKVLPQFQRLVRQWLRALAETGWLTQEGTTFTCQRSLRQVPASSGIPSSRWGDALSAYLDRSIGQHSALLQGSCSALELFFVDDHAVTRALYADNPAAQCVAANVQHIVDTLTAQSTSATPWQVLEVGAGTGATTGSVLSGLGDQCHRYHFTDVSTLFLDDARTRFATRDDMAWSLFDINQPVDYTQHPAEGYDLVVAAQVMHDASHIVRSLKRLASLMKPGARLLLIEATNRDSQLQMASVGFIEGLGNYQDYRLLEDRAMLNLEQWHDALQQAGFIPELAWPYEAVSPLHQHVIVARMTRAAKADCTALQQVLQRQFAATVPALSVVQCEPLTLCAYDDTPRPSQPEVGTSAIPASDNITPQDETLIKEVARVWQSLLGRPVSAQTDFFQSGGDSLIATRAIAQLNRAGIAGASLQALFDQPTLAGFCRTLSGRRQAINPLLVPLTQGSSGETVLVCHASDGGVTPYLCFAQALTQPVWGLQAAETITEKSLTALAEAYVQSINDLAEGQTLTLVGWSYGASVAATIAQLLHQRGRAIRLVLIDPVCGRDFAPGDLSALMRLMLRERHISLPDSWERLPENARIDAFITHALAAGMIAQPMSAGEARPWLTRVLHLLTLQAEYQPGPAVPVPCLWLEAGSRPSHWTPTKEDWAGWKASSQRHTVDATHWQLMDDPEIAGELASLVTQWLNQISCQEQMP